MGKKKGALEEVRKRGSGVMTGQKAGVRLDDSMSACPLVGLREAIGGSRDISPLLFSKGPFSYHQCKVCKGRSRGPFRRLLSDSGEASSVLSSTSFFFFSPSSSMVIAVAFCLPYTTFAPHSVLSPHIHCFPLFLRSPPPIQTYNRTFLLPFFSRYFLGFMGGCVAHFQCSLH